MLDTQMPVNSVREELDSIDNEIVKELDKLFAKQQAEIDELRKKLNRFLKRSHQKNVDITELVDMLNVIWEDWSCDECPEYEQLKALIAKHKEKE